MRRTYKFDLTVMEATEEQLERIWCGISDVIDKEKLNFVGSSAPEVKKR